jgi:hypothetical protein
MTSWVCCLGIETDQTPSPPETPTMWLNSPFQGRIKDSRRLRDQSRAAHRAFAPRRSSLPRIEVLENRALLSVLTVTTNADSGSGSLRDTIAAAPSGAVIKFARNVHQITLTTGQLQIINKSLDIEGPGATRLTISGNDTSRVFDIEGTQPVTIAGLTITHGRSDNTAVNHQGIGGAIYHNGEGNAAMFITGGTLTLSRVVVSNSQAIGSLLSPADPTYPGHIAGAFAGGVFNQDGTLNISHSTLINNKAIGADDATGAGTINTDVGDAEGGCINNSSVFASAFLSVNDSSVIGNIAQAGNRGVGSAVATNNILGVVDLAVGGGIMNFYFAFLPAPQPVVTSTASIINTKLIGNQVIGGNNAKGGNASRDIVGVAEGGGVSNDANCSLIITRSQLSGNKAIGGSGGTGGTGVVQQVDVGEGAGIGDIGTYFVNGDTFINNVAQGGSGGTPGTGATLLQQVDIGEGGGLASILGVGNGIIIKSSFVHNVARGGIGADGLGGGLFNGAGDTSTIIASLFTLNQAIGGEGGQGIGGGVFSFGTIINLGILTNKHKPNHASTSNNDIFLS